MTKPLAAAGQDPIERLARHRLIALFLDVDGTLAPIAQTPSKARVPQSTRHLLARLRSHSGVAVVIVSGRSATEARELVGVPVDVAIGNHGLEFARGASHPRPILAASERKRMATAARRIRLSIAELEGVWLEDKRWTLAVHYRAAPSAIERALRRRVRGAVRGVGVQLLWGKKVIDVKPGGGWHKGKAVRLLLRKQYGPGWSRTVGVLYAGDDVTDEDVFSTAPKSVVTIKVGRGPTQAAYRTRSPSTLAAWLDQLERTL